MIAQWMYLEYVDEESGEHQLPLFDRWKPDGHIDRTEALPQAKEWMAFKRNHPVKCFFGIGRPNIGTWNVYYHDIQPLAYRMAWTPLCQLCRMSEGEIVSKFRECCHTYLENAESDYVRGGVEMAMASFRLYRALYIAGLKFEITDAVPRHLSWEAFTRSLE